MKSNKPPFPDEKYKPILVLLLGFLFSSCSSKNIIELSAKTYEYKYWATTGLSHSILLNGKNAFLEFRPDSDSVALKTLTNLVPCIGYLKENHIFVVGQYDGKIRWSDESGVDYINFKLLNWYISTPFLEIPSSTCHDESWVNVPKLSRSQLRKEDFILNSNELQGVDLSKFQKEEHKL